MNPGLSMGMEDEKGYLCNYLAEDEDFNDIIFIIKRVSK